MRYWLILCFGLLICGCSESPQSSLLVPPPHLLQQPEQQQAGAVLFYRYCRECHGTLSEGRNRHAGRFVAAAPDFKSRSYLDTKPAYLYMRIAQGKQVEPYRSQGSVMPAWKAHLSEQQIWQLVAYLRQRAGAD